MKDDNDLKDKNKKRKHRFIDNSIETVNNDKINFYQNLLYDINKNKNLLKISKLLTHINSFKGNSLSLNEIIINTPALKIKSKDK